MHCRELIEVAVTLAERSDVLVACHPRLSERHLQQYWVAARGLLNSWGTSIRRCVEQMESTDYVSDALWLKWTPTLEEILLSEIQTRVWACLLEECDRRAGLHEYSPVGTSIFSGHLDLRRRILAILLRGRQLAAYPVWRLNRTRVSVETWTDLLLASLQVGTHVERYGFDRHRLEQPELPPMPSTTTHETSALLRLAVVRAAARMDFEFLGEVDTERQDMHRATHAAIIGAWCPAHFRETGPLAPAWQMRLMGLADDTQGMLELWAGADESTAEPDTDRIMRRFTI
ncbi:MAG: hypothetical protein KDB23_15570 [Planctomycetales bacterium]|nr:hypothetical protein [Planctomycetales bacterium]